MPLIARAATALCHPFAVTATVDYEVRRAQGDRELRDALTLRHDVFCREQGVPEREEVDGRDPEGIHLVAVADGQLLVLDALQKKRHTTQLLSCSYIAG